MRSIYLVLVLSPGLCWGQGWQQLPDFPGTARDDAASFTIGNDTYVGTGMEVGWGLTNDWWKFDGTTFQWSQVASLPSSGRQYCTGLEMDGKGYLFGGVDSTGALNDFWEYDPLSDQWDQLPNMPSTGRYACAGCGYGSVAYIATGMMETGIPTNEFWKYNNQSQTWTQQDPIPGIPRHRTAYSCVNDFKIFGGADSLGNALSDAWQFPMNAIGAGWVQSADLYSPRYGADAEYWMIIGGASSDTLFHDDFWSYDFFLGAQPLPSFPGGPRRGGVTGVIQGLGVAFLYGTGIDQNLVRQNDWWMILFPSNIDEVGELPIALHPNPATDRVRPELPENWPFAECVVRDVLGRVVHKQHVEQGSFIDLAGLPAGRYDLMVQYGDERLRAALIVVP